MEVDDDALSPNMRHGYESANDDTSALSIISCHFAIFFFKVHGRHIEYDVMLLAIRHDMPCRAITLCCLPLCHAFRHYFRYADTLLHTPHLLLMLPCCYLLMPMP